MAIVKAPALSIDASGNLGGVCYSKWRGLNIARDTWTGTVPNTPKQIVMQANIATVSQAWGGTLIESEREKWRQAAESEVRLSRIKTGYIPTGYQFFVQLNMQVKRQGLSLIKIPPVKPTPYGFEVLGVTFDAGGAWVIWYALNHFVSVPAGYQAELWVAGPIDSGGYTARPQDYRFVRYWSLLSGAYVSNPVNNKYYWGKYRWVHEDGWVGNWFIRSIYIDV